MRRFVLAVALLLIVGVPVVIWAVEKEDPVEFKEARLRVEINATDGDAGLQIDLDHEPWQSLRLETPDGRTILDVQNRGVLEGYGLTELFSESSEPPFTEFPLDEFESLFPEGIYTFTATTVDGTPVRSTFELTHAFPAGPEILSPVEEATVTSDRLVVEWDPGDQPEDVEIVAYEVLVVDEENPRHELDLFLGPEARSLTVPVEFLESGEYKVEVLAIEAGGNQTLTEVAFTVA